MSQLEVTTIEKRIEETRLEISKCQEITDFRLRDALLSELNLRLDDLLKQKHNIDDSIWKETIKLRISGERVQSGRISTRTLVSILDGFTQLTDSIANSILNTPSNKGRIPQFVQDAVDFQVVGVFPGSFGIILEKPDHTYSLLPSTSKTEAVLNEVFTLLETNGNIDALFSNIVPNGNRAISNYKTWLTEIDENNVDVELIWDNRAAERRVINVFAKDTSPIICALDSINNIVDEEICLEGVLTGINVRKNRFEITVEGLGIIQGNGKFETLITVSELMGENVRANLIRSTTLSQAGIQKHAWYLLSALLK